MTYERRSPRDVAARRFGLSLLAMVLALATLTSHADAEASVRGGTLRIGWIPGAKTLDPHFSVIPDLIPSFRDLWLEK